MLKNNIAQLIGPNCFNTGVLKQNMPLIKNYLKNYYQDLYGNKIDADLKDYFIAYYTFKKNLSLIPVLGLSSCLYLMTELGITNWTRFALWLLVGLIIYIFYGYRNSKLKKLDG